MESDSTPQSALGHINRGIDAHEAGDDARAQRHFAEALLLEPENDVAWLWMTESSSEPAEQLYCLNRAVKINPDSRGRIHRDRLRLTGVTPVIPAAISDLKSPPLPPTYRPKPSVSVISRALPTTGSILKRRRRPVPSTADSKDSGNEKLPGVLRNRRLLWVAAVVGLLLAIGSFWLIHRAGDDDGVLYLAVAGPATGERSNVGEEFLNGGNLAAQQWNASNDGPDLKIVFFDDEDDPDKAVEVARAIVAEERFVGVIGHGRSATTLAAAPIYAAAGMPAISPTSTTDELSKFPDYFQTIFSDHTEGLTLAAYLRDVLSVDRVTIVAGESLYEVNISTHFSESYVAAGGTVVEQFNINAADADTSITDIVAQIEALDDPGMIFLATTEVQGHAFLLKLRRAGVTIPIMGSESMGSSAFAEGFADEPEEADDPGFFTDGMYAASPLIFDSVGADSVRFADRYEHTFGKVPSWRPARTWDAVAALAEAEKRSDLPVDGDDLPEIREQMLVNLHAMKDLDSSFRGLSGSFFFRESGDSPQALSVGQFTNQLLSSSPTQYRLVTNPSQYDMAEEIASGRAIEVDGFYLRQYRVVYVGIEMIELHDLNTTEQSFRADFFIYFRWDGDDYPLDIIFTNSSTANLALGTPISEQVTDAGQNYRLYRVQGTFQQPMDFHAYPWDRHALTIRFVHPVLNQNDLVFVPDPAALEMTQAQRQQSSMDLSRSFNSIPSWNIDEVTYTQVSVTSTADDYDTEGLVQYSEFQLIIDAGRDVNSFLGKNLLPLVLLTLVTYIAIWFPAEQAGARIGFAITALLSSSVMLNSIASQLPDIGYTVAIEWGYYIYLGMSALLILLTIAVDRSYKAKRFARVKKLDTLIRIGYPIAIGSTVFFYWWNFYR